MQDDQGSRPGVRKANCVHMTSENRKAVSRLSLDDFCSSLAERESDLPRLPNPDELALIRKGLRKKVAPSLEVLPQEYEYEGVGRIEKLVSTNDIIITWSVKGGQVKRASFSDLCNLPASELDRLELGWMIANFARLDGVEHLKSMRPISYEDFHQDDFNRRYANQKKHFQEIENDWRRWAVAKPGHMKIVA